MTLLNMFILFHLVGSKEIWVQRNLGQYSVIIPFFYQDVVAASASLHPLPGLPQRAGNAEIAGEREDRQSAAGSR